MKLKKKRGALSDIELMVEGMIALEAGIFLIILLEVEALTKFGLQWRDIKYHREEMYQQLCFEGVKL